MKVIVGLGNPGIEYKHTRHNLGFWIIDRFLESKNILNFVEKHRSLIHKDGDIIFCKPQTFMNNSGHSLREIKNFYKLKNEDFLVIYDDLYISTGAFKFSINSGHGGHNGIRNIIECLGGNDFLRLRVGIGPRERANVIADYVMENFSKEDVGKIGSTMESIFNAIEDFIAGSEHQKLQNKFNFSSLV